MKENVELCPWADVVYGCDPAWWRFRRGLPEFKGLKVAWEGGGLSEYPDIRKIKIAPGRGGDRFTDSIVLDEGSIGGGRNSGFQALNLAVQWGARRFILIGFDMSESAGVHWYGRNRWPLAANPNAVAFRGWIEAFERAAPVLRSIGAEVVNCSPYSALNCFPKRSIEGALAAWQM